MHPFTVALDWTPNINHIGFFVAKELGFYEESDLEVRLVDPSEDDYKVTPAKKVEKGSADVALCPTESIISYRTKGSPFDLIAIAAVLKEDLSAITVNAKSSISTPADLDGKTYASYQARYEDGIVKELIRNAGGKGNIEIYYPDKLGIWDTILNGTYDSTWIFTNWEGVAAAASDHEILEFRLRDYDIPYSYSPVIAASESRAKEAPESYRYFLKDTKRGFLYCIEHPDEAIRILEKHVPESDKHIDLNASLNMSSPYFGDAENWGYIRNEVMETFTKWIEEKGLESRLPSLDQLFTNKYLSQ